MPPSESDQTPAVGVCSVCISVVTIIKQRPSQTPPVSTQASTCPQEQPTHSQLNKHNQWGQPPPPPSAMQLSSLPLLSHPCARGRGTNAKLSAKSTFVTRAGQGGDSVGPFDLIKRRKGPCMTMKNKSGLLLLHQPPCQAGIRDVSNSRLEPGEKCSGQALRLAYQGPGFEPGLFPDVCYMPSSLLLNEANTFLFQLGLLALLLQLRARE
jgi:hypothetical protein